MKKLFHFIAVAISAAVIGSGAGAATVSPFDAPLSAGDSTSASISLMANESAQMLFLSFTAATDLAADVSITINPILAGNSSNTLSLAYAVTSGPFMPVSFTEIPVSSRLSVGVAGLDDVMMGAGDVLAFLLTGTAGPLGNQLTFSVDTTAPAPVPLPAAGFLLLGGLGGLALMRKRAAAA